jgi:hypothetical protein
MKHLQVVTPSALLLNCHMNKMAEKNQGVMKENYLKLAQTAL